MSKTIPALLAAFAFAVVGSTPASADGMMGPRTATLTVTGQGSVSRAPDRATVGFRVETTADRAADATSANAAIANELTRRMAALGLPARALTTSGYGLSYNPRPPKPDPASQQRYGYTVERTFSVALDDIERAGAVVDAGVAAGVTGVNGITYTLRDRPAAERSAQTAALADAVAQAKGLAAAAGLRLVRILALAPNGRVPGPVPMAMARVMTAPGVPTTIDAGDLSVDASVTVRYEVAPAGH